jgi:zinc transport system ATP-binding protein
VPATVREVVASGRLARRGLLWPLRKADHAVVADAIDAVDLLPFADTDLNVLSGGQQRRVLIARALAAQPDVMVMDEPTAGVDRASQEALAGTVARLRERGVTVLVVTHEVGALADVVTRALVLHDGRITFDGPLTAELAGGADSHHVHDPANPVDAERGLLGSFLGGHR